MCANINFSFDDINIIEYDDSLSVKKKNISVYMCSVVCLSTISYCMC